MKVCKQEIFILRLFIPKEYWRKWNLKFSNHLLKGKGRQSVLKRQSKTTEWIVSSLALEMSKSCTECNSEWWPIIPKNEESINQAYSYTVSSDIHHSYWGNIKSIVIEMINYLVNCFKQWVPEREQMKNKMNEQCVCVWAP